MSALHLVAQPRLASLSNSPTGDRAFAKLFVDEVAEMPTLDRASKVSLLMDLCDAVQTLAEGSKLRQVVPFDVDGAPWECALEGCKRDLLLSLYSSGPIASIVTHDRRAPVSQFLEDLTVALGEVYGDTEAADGGHQRSRVAVRAAALQRQFKSPDAIHDHTVSKRAHISLEGLAFGGVFLKAQGSVRSRLDPGGSARQVERSDLHALLGQGTLFLRARHIKVDIRSSQLFVDTERLLPCAEEVMGSWEAGRMLATRVFLSGVGLSLYRTRSDGPIEITVRGGGPSVRQAATQLVSIESLDWVRAIAHFAVQLTESLCEIAPAQERNLRLVALRRRAEALLERATIEDDSLTNSRPEPYRKFAKNRRSMSSGVWDRGGKMHFTARWVATVPGLDLRATFLCGESVIVDSNRETACIDRANGTVLWRSPSGPAACTASPAGLIRFRPDGHLSSLDIRTGEVRFATQLRPRTGGGAAGSVVHTDGLPKILAVTEGDRQISAVDLLTGALRWRHTAARPGSYRLRRVGKLFLVAGGNGTLFALDVSTGEAIWRLCNRLPFTGALAVDRRSAVAISGAPAAWKLHHIDPWTGEAFWSAEIVEAPLPGKAPLLTSKVVVVPVGNESSAGAEAFDRETGQSLWKHQADLASPTSAWMAFDDVIVINDAAGVLVCLDALTGRPLFNHVFAGNCEADTPRRLEPVLRNGALFVPQQQVHVLRPRTGEIIGTVPPDLVPDLLRVDELCNVYVGEESGHLAAFATAPRLAVV